VRLQHASVIAEHLADAREAPAQRAARIVWQLPEQLAQPFALMLAAVDRQIGEQRARLARGGQRQRSAVAQDREGAEHADLQAASALLSGILSVKRERREPLGRGTTIGRETDRKAGGRVLHVVSVPMTVGTSASSIVADSRRGV